MLVPILYEPIFARDSIWCSQIRNGIEKTLIQRKYSSVIIDGETYQSHNYDTLFSDSPRLLILVASHQTWIHPALQFFNANQIHVVLVNCYPWINKAVKGQVTFNYAEAVNKLLSYLSHQNCHHTALYGVFRNSSTDYIKRRTFEAALQVQGRTDIENYVFENSNGLEECYKQFRKHISVFDSVICVNDIAALMLEKRLKADGIKIPEQIRIACFGASSLIEAVSSPITVMFSNYELLGQHAVLTFRYLYNSNSDSINSKILISPKLIEKGLPQPIDPHQNTVSKDSSSPFFADGPAPNFYDDDDVRTFSKIEKLMLICDTSDFHILNRILKGFSYENIADELHFSRSAVFYRVKRMAETVNIKSIEEFKQFLSSNHFQDILKNASTTLEK